MPARHRVLAALLAALAHAAPAAAEAAGSEGFPPHWSASCADKSVLDWPCALSFVQKRVQIVGAEKRAAEDAALKFRRGCAHVLLVSRNETAVKDVFDHLSGYYPAIGVCPPGVEPVLSWASEDIRNKTFSWELTSIAFLKLGGLVDVSWNFEDGSDRRDAVTS